MNRIDQAVQCFKANYSCSQAVLAAYAPDYGLSHDLALTMAQAFGAGMGRMGLTCGAVTGAFLVLGLRYGGSDAKNLAQKENTYAKVRQFAGLFQQRHGSIVCKDLLGCDIGTPEGLKQLIENNMLSTHCARFVESASQILEDLLQP